MRGSEKKYKTISDAVSALDDSEKASVSIKYLGAKITVVGYGSILKTLLKGPLSEFSNAEINRRYYIKGKPARIYASL